MTDAPEQKCKTMIGSALLAVGLVLTTTSQLRLRGLPLGGGEICLALWLVCASLRILISGRVYNARALLGLGTFWVCFALTLSLGTSLALLRKELDPEPMFHDTFAYLLVAALSCFIVATMKSIERVNQTLWFLIAFWNIALVVALALFSINHFIFRHPSVWFALATSLILGTERAPSHARIGS
jgi:hypothetical protein